MATLSPYLKTWRLKLSRAKMMTSTFHSHNREAKRELKVYAKLMLFCPVLTYHEVKLYRSLTTRHHVETLHIKLSNRAMLLRRLAVSGWGAGAKTLSQGSHSHEKLLKILENFFLGKSWKFINDEKSQNFINRNSQSVCRDSSCGRAPGW